MKVNQLYIICVFDDVQNPDEIKNGGEALWTRYSQRPPKGMRLIHVETCDPDWEEEPKTKVIRSQGEMAASAADTVGVYVYGHGSLAAQTLGNLAAKQLAEVLTSAPLALKRIDKVCLLSCKLGQHSEATATPGSEYLNAFCVALGVSNIRPKVAGWNDFVTVAYAGMEKKYHPRKNKKTEQELKVVPNDWSKTTVGKKVAHGLTGQLNSKPAFINPAMREKMKVYCMLIDGHVQSIGYEDWHDK